jgi:hypothetical protein
MHSGYYNPERPSCARQFSRLKGRAPEPQVDLELYRRVPEPGPRIEPVRFPTHILDAVNLFLHEGVGHGGHTWYDNMYQNFVKLFDNQNNCAELFILFLGATSPMAGIKSNVTNARKAWEQYCRWHGQCFEGFLPVHETMLRRAVNNEYLTTSGMKVPNFVASMFGSQTAVCVDRWMMRAFKRSGDVPNDAEYFGISEATRFLASENGLTPPQAQAAIWVGVKMFSDNILQFGAASFEEEYKRQEAVAKGKREQMKFEFAMNPGEDLDAQGQERLLEIAAELLH